MPRRSPSARAHGRPSLAGLWETLGAPQTMTADERRYYYEHGYLSLANAITPVRPCSLPAVPLCRTH